MQTMTNEAPVGVVTIGKTTYTVYRLEVGENAREAGMVNQFALEGPRGATFYVIDYGPRYRLNSIALGGGTFRTCSPRPLRDLTRAHLAAFGVEG